MLFLLPLFLSIKLDVYHINAHGKDQVSVSQDCLVLYNLDPVRCEIHDLKTGKRTFQPELLQHIPEGYELKNFYVTKDQAIIACVTQDPINTTQVIHIHRKTNKVWKSYKLYYVYPVGLAHANDMDYIAYVYSEEGAIFRFTRFTLDGKPLEDILAPIDVTPVKLQRFRYAEPGFKLYPSDSGLVYVDAYNYQIHLIQPETLDTKTISIDPDAFPRLPQDQLSALSSYFEKGNKKYIIYWLTTLLNRKIRPYIAEIDDEGHLKAVVQKGSPDIYDAWYLKKDFTLYQTFNTKDKIFVFGEIRKILKP